MKKNKTKSVVSALLLCLLACVLGLAACTNGNVRLTFYNGEETVAEFTGKSGEQIGDVPLPVKTGYTFTGWATAKGEPFTSAELPSKNTKVYAQFAANTYTVTFHYGRGKVGVPVTVDRRGVRIFARRFHARGLGHRAKRGCGRLHLARRYSQSYRRKGRKRNVVCLLYAQLGGGRLCGGKRHGVCLYRFVRSCNVARHRPTSGRLCV